MWLTEGCGGRRCTVATPNRESREGKEEDKIRSLTKKLYKYDYYNIYNTIS